MKHVFNTYECIHVWSTQTQNDGRNQTGNVFFDGSTIYSYGHHFPIASFCDANTVLINSRSYSITTSRHRGAVLSALPYNIKTFTVPEVEIFGTRNHIHNIIYLVDRFHDAMKTAARASKYNHYQYGALGYLTCLREYVKYFKLATELNKRYRDLYKVYKRDVKEIESLSAAFKDKLAIQAEYNRVHQPEIQARRDKAKHKREELEARAIEAYRNKQFDNLELWKAGELAHYGYNDLPRSKFAYLRIKDGKIETSQGASIPVDRANHIWLFIITVRKAGKEFNSTSLHYESINRLFSPYWLRSVSVTGDLFIGCHHIQYAELERIARLLNLI